MTTKKIRVRGYIEVVMEVPKIITLEEISARFKQHAKDGKYYIKQVKLLSLIALSVNMATNFSCSFT